MTRPTPAPLSRNHPCPCGSGKRYKHCCGSVEEAAPSRPAQPSLGEILNLALKHQLAGKLSLAEKLYREVLETDAHNVNALHMLGVICMERLRYGEAIALLSRAAELTNWNMPAIRHNLGLALSRLLARETTARQEYLLAQHLEWQERLTAHQADTFPLISVIIPSYNHAAYIRTALDSVFGQTYRNLELIVIDDGSADGSPQLITELLQACPFPHRFIARANRGAEQTLNEGAALAHGSYLAFLNSDDYFAPDRIERMVAAIAARGARWGFSGVNCVDHHGMDVSATHPTARSHLRMVANVLGKISNSFAFLEFNPAISTGNLFVEKSLFDVVGGFRQLRYNHDWDFCLRASSRAEPVFVETPLYHYRLHGSNTISESNDRNREDANRFFSEYYLQMEDSASAENELSPSHADNRTLLYKLGLGVGHGELVPVDRLRALCAPWFSAKMQEKSATAPVSTNRKQALVVLGMHRSGTSAFSRVINLCGAFLPDNRRPAKLNNNDKGFWEPEEVIQLNERLLKAIGASWLNAGFDLAGHQELRADFMDDAATLLDAEYGEQALILIKDPRICLLTPWWDEALRRCGYAPLYVIPVRNPLEVADSLHARDGLPVETGLALWLRYFDQAEAATRDARRVFVNYADLMADWKHCISAISHTLDVRLDVESGAQEINSFLEEGLRRQRSSDESLFELVSTPLNEAIKEKYRWALQQAAARP